MSTLGKRRTIYLIADSRVLSDKNAGLDLTSPHAYNKGDANINFIN